MNPILRQAIRADVPAIMRVRHAVRENRLVSRVIPEEEVVHAIEVTGRGWVVEDDGQVVAFAIGNAIDGNIWALFVEPAYEGRGYGRMLHDAMLNWLWSRDLRRLWLSTEPETRARRFYARAGWREVGPLPSGEVLLEMHAPMPTRVNAVAGQPRFARRASLLIACLAMGLAIGFVGQGLTSRPEWFLAIPACLIFAWLFVADPTECVAPEISRRHDGAVDGESSRHGANRSATMQDAPDRKR